ASSSANAQAYIVGINAYALGGTGTASVDITGNVDVTAIGGTHANAAIGYISASAHTHDDANVTIGNVDISASASSGSATAHLGSVSAGASGINSYANVTIGNVTVEAHAHNDGNALAHLGQIVNIDDHEYALGIVAAGINNASAHVALAQVHVSADAGNSGFGDADAYIVGIDAYANQFSHANVDITGNVDVIAHGNDIATAVIGHISASAYNHDQADITIGNVAVSADAGSFGNAHIGVITANAFCSTGGQNTAHVQIGDVTVQAIAGDSAYATLDRVGAHANHSGTADVAINQVSVHASASNNAAYAQIGAISAHATTLSNANIHITNSVHVDATGATASAHIGNLQAIATEVGAVTSGTDLSKGSNANLTIGGNVEVHASADNHADAAVVSIFAKAVNESEAGIAPKADFSFVSTNGFVNKASAYAALSDILANHPGYTAGSAILRTHVTAFSSATYGIAGNIKLHYASVSNALSDVNADIYIDNVDIYAHGDSANASLGNVVASASGTSQTGNLAISNNAHALIDISGNLTVHADATAAMANAHVGTVSASALDHANANLYIGGQVSIDATGKTASATLGSLQSVAKDSSDANLTIAGDLAISADATNGHAYASLSTFVAHATGDSVANLSINGDVTIEAHAAGINHSATAMLDNGYRGIQA
ncbi:hypothetical protein G6677_09260, partial [Polynucleobacter paneuropaeus]|nr:hypothetical protein [Polynucleobacter paneuropaeus]